MVTDGLWPGYTCVGRAGGVLGAGRLANARHLAHCARSLRACLTTGEQTTPLQRGCLPSRSCSATAAPRLPDRSRAAIRAPHAINNVTLCVPNPLAETPPPSGWADGAQRMRLRPRAPG